MLIVLADALILADRCAPSVAATTMMSVVRVESGFNPLAIGVNGAPRLTVKAADKADAVRQATALITSGRSVDLGLAQINSKNLQWLGLSVEDAFDPCRNLAAGARILQDAYRRSGPEKLGPQPALLQALSYYNTGNPRRGFGNGYVAKVTAAANVAVPALAPPSAPSTQGAAPAPRSAWDVFGNASPSTFVIRVTPQAPGALK